MCCMAGWEGGGLLTRDRVVAVLCVAHGAGNSSHVTADYKKTVV